MVYNWFAEPFADSERIALLFGGMHGLVFRRSIHYWQDQPGIGKPQGTLDPPRPYWIGLSWGGRGIRSLNRLGVGAVPLAGPSASGYPATTARRLERRNPTETPRVPTGLSPFALGPSHPPRGGGERGPSATGVMADGRSHE